MRGILSAVLLASATLAVPAAPAAGTQYAAYEVVLHRYAGAQKTRVSITAATDGPAAAVMFMELQPAKAGYDMRSIAVGTFAGGSEGFKTYGWPVAPPCPTSCAPAYQPFKTGFDLELEPTIGTRYLVAGPRGKTKVTVSDKKHWQVRPISLGLRTVLAKDADATGVNWEGVALERFSKASAPGGRYGSAVFAEAPCYTAGAGSATLTSDNGDRGWGVTCDGAFPFFFDFASTNEGGRWTFQGNVVGDYVSPYRLIVFDFPKPR